MGFVTCAETSNLEDREREQDAESRVEADVGSGASPVTWCHVLSITRRFFFQRHLLNVEQQQLQQCSTQPGRMAFKGKSFFFGKILSQSQEPRETLLKHHGPDDNLARSK
jgi:hypothetical protein